jgi:hypothetical protein
MKIMASQGKISLVLLMVVIIGVFMVGAVASGLTMPESQRAPAVGAQERVQGHRRLQ